jgi:hypothetical protein
MGASLFMTMVATQNFRSVDRLLAAPGAPAAEQINRMGHDAARQFLRYQVSEQNRWYFETWERIQLFLGAAMLATLLAAHRSKAALAISALMLVVVAAAHWGVTPSIIKLGRAIDFQSAAAPPSAERTRFWTLHTAYSAMEVTKWGLGAILAGTLLSRRRQRSDQAGDEIDLVDEADHRHVDG